MIAWELWLRISGHALFIFWGKCKGGDGMMEVWKDIPGYEGKYQVSNKGRVKSLSRKDAKGQSLPERILKLQDNGRGYKKVTLWSNGVGKKYFVHYLVAATFIPNPCNYKIVHHIDEDPSNNDVKNLKWCTQSENVKAGSATQRRLANTDFSRKRISEKSLQNLISQREKQKKKVDQYSLTGDFIKTWSSVSEAAKAIGGQSSNIASCAAGRRKTAYGYIWRYGNV